ncbi:MAG: hypothetical protein DMF81_22525, partial [Acidobacteria bacterium]
APQLTFFRPVAGEYTAATAVDVTGGVLDAVPVTVRVEGVTASVDGSRFVARGVAIGEGPDVVLRAVAEDAAGNVADASITLRVDRDAPLVHIAAPGPGTFLRGGTVEVSGTVEDAAPVIVDVNGIAALVSGEPSSPAHSFSASVPVTEGPLALVATARDAAGNVGRGQVEVRVDSVAPVILLIEPGTGAVTKRESVRLAGTVADASPVTLQVRDAVVPLAGGAFAFDAPLTDEGTNILVLTATDGAGNAGRLEVTVVRDTTPPQLEVVAPVAGTVLGALPVVVQGFVRDATETLVTVDGVPAERIGEAWRVEASSLDEGSHAFAVVARDAAGNQSSLVRDVVVDRTAPVVAVVSPASGAVTAAASQTVTGTVDDHSAVTVLVAGTAAAITGAGPFAFTAAVPLAECDNRLPVVATDAAGHRSEVEVLITRDSIPPVIALSAPESLSRGRPGEALATAADNVGLARVTMRVDVNGREGCAGEAGTFEAPPFRLALSVPACAVSGEVLTVAAEAVDRAGNTASASRGVRVSSDGVVTGQVLSDVTGRPLPGATVRVVGGAGAGAVTTTDGRGRYSLPARDTDLVLAAEAPGTTSVEREVVVASGAGTVPVDARLTPLADAVALGPAGGAISHWTAGPVAVTVSAGAVSAETSIVLTPLSPQGLPGLLPLGWSPLAAFDLKTAAPLAPPLAAELTGLPAGAAHLVAYRPSTHGWFMVSPGLVASDGALSLALTAPGAYAVVVPDLGEPPVAVPAAEEALSGVDMVPLPPTASSAGETDPATLPPTGGTARGRLVVQSPVALPSGTVVQAEMTESFRLASGETASEEKRTQDIVLFRPPGGVGSGAQALAAELPVTPGRSYATMDLVEGKVHLDILAGRESVRGRTGGSEAVVLEAGDAMVSVAARALPEDTAIDLQSVQLSRFLPAGAGLEPLAELVLDLSGQRLAIPAELSVAAGSARPGDTILVARVERLDGLPRLAVIATGEVVGERVVSSIGPRPWDSCRA